LKHAEPEVLLVGPSLNMSPFFAEQMRGRGFACRGVACYRDAEGLLKHHAFDLVLSEMQLPDGSGLPLMARLEGTDSTLFFCVRVHRGSWWLPAVERGRVTWGAAALRSDEFLKAWESLLPATVVEMPAVELHAEVSETGPRKLPQRVEAFPAPLRKAMA
jgi:DNA-binding NtrC family response regulator